MKKYILFFIFIGIFLTVNAGYIVGKWECSKEFLDDLGLYYDQMNGHYKFKKDGTFTVIITGRERTSKYAEVSRGLKPEFLHAEFRRIRIKVKGTYKIVNDSISTTVHPEDVYCYIEAGRDYPDAIDAKDSEYAIRMKESLQELYEIEKYMNETQKQTVKRELMHVWIWAKEPITVSKEILSIKNITFMRS